MKVIIAGGRDYYLTYGDFKRLEYIDKVNSEHIFREIVSGGATGADKAGEQYAEYHHIPIKRFPADWKTHGKAAGPIRNKQMVEYADAVILFPGGKGTANMRKLAKEYGLKILYDTGVNK